VTGATDGIGLAYCHELAKKGMNIVLISRNREKLDREAAEIASKYNVDTKVVVVDFNVAWEVAKAIEPAIRNLDIGVLVNNVGISYDFPDYLHELSPEMMRKIIDLNIVSVVEMVRIVLPGMKERQRGAIVNLSSGSGNQPTPLLALYGAAKSFVDRFSQALQTEYASDRIIVQSMTPFFVATNMSKMRPSLMVPTPQAFAEEAVNTLGHDAVTHGYMLHNLQGYVMRLLPASIVQKKIMQIHLGYRQRALRKREEKKSS
jgi:17beta-estradiol 17-dehydrogenase / very-long-chain 3-oxoacyl-CoA reductase